MIDLLLWAGMGLGTGSAVVRKNRQGWGFSTEKGQKVGPLSQDPRSIKALATPSHSPPSCQEGTLLSPLGKVTVPSVNMFFQT